MVKGIALFIAGLVACFVAVKAAGVSDVSAPDMSGFEAQISQLQKKDKKRDKEIEQLKNELASLKLSKPEVNSSASVGSIDEAAVKDIVAELMEEKKSENEEIIAAQVKESVKDFTANIDENTIKTVASNFRKIMGESYKNRLIQGIELDDGQKEQLDVIWTEHREAMGSMREKINARITDQTTDEERREIWREETTRLSESSNEKVRNVLNDDVKFEKYQENSKSMWGGRSRGGR